MTHERHFRGARVRRLCSRSTSMTFELNCEGLTVEQLATRSVPTSTMSLLGMTRHLARVEHSWTRRVLEGQAELP